MEDIPEVIPYARHSLHDDDMRAVMEVLREDSASQRLTQGFRTSRLEVLIREYTTAEHAVACSSGTAGLHASLFALGVSTNDIVITSGISFCSTANVVRHCGGVPLFADIDEDALGLCPRSVREALEWAKENGKRVKAVIVVSMGGVAHASAELRDLCKAYGCRIVEDAAHTLGGRYADGRAVGCGEYADITVFSLHAIKPITSGEGGVATTNDEELARRMRLFCNHGIERDVRRFKDDVALSAREMAAQKMTYGYQHYQMQVLGLNYRMSELHAALGCSQMRRIDSKRDRRKELAERYDRLLDDILIDDVNPLSSIIKPLQRNYRERSAHHLYVTTIDWHRLAINRKRFMQTLANTGKDGYGICTQVHYIPIYEHPYYREAAKFTERALFEAVKLPRSAEYAKRALSLPLFTDMPLSAVERVVDALKELVDNCLKRDFKL